MIALIIIYNHRYDKNIAHIERLYQKRFSHIYHLMPFYTGNQANVIPVYENSHYFQGYIAQGLKSYFDDKYEHYFFIGDDLLLNPAIDENNYQEIYKLDAHKSFLPGFINLHEAGTWPRVAEAYRYSLKSPGVEIEEQLPSYDEAIELLARNGLTIKPLTYEQVFGGLALARPHHPQFSIRNSRGCWRPWNIIKYVKKYLLYLVSKIKYKVQSPEKKGKLHLSYPIVGAYSDICLVSKDIIKVFAHYCGCFAASDLFVEDALPTAMAFSTNNIVTEKDLELRGRALWTAEDYQILSKYNCNLRQLLDDFPAGYMYLHPIKLSRWNTQEVK